MESSYLINFILKDKSLYSRAILSQEKWRQKQIDILKSDKSNRISPGLYSTIYILVSLPSVLIILEDCVLT